MAKPSTEQMREISRQIMSKIIGRLVVGWSPGSRYFGAPQCQRLYDVTTTHKQVT